MDLPLGSDIEMIEALLAHMQQNQVAGGGSQIYDDLQDDDDEDDYDDDDEDDDEDDYYAAAGGGDQVPIGMYQNPFGGGEEASADMMQGLGMQGLQNLLAMGNPGGDMGGMVGGMDGGGLDVSSFLPNNVASVGAAFMSAAGGLMDGLGGGGQHGGVSIKEYDEEDEEELTESESEEEDDIDETDEEDERHHMSGMGQMAAAMGGLVMGGAGVAALAGMMNPNQQHMGGPNRGHPMMSPPHHGGAPSFLNMGHGMNGHPQMTQNPSYSNNMSPPQSSNGGNMVAAAAASVAAAAAALMPKSSQHQTHHPAALGAPNHHMGNPNHMNMPSHMEAPNHMNPSSHMNPSNHMSAPNHMNAPPTIQNQTPTTLSPPMSISSNLGGGTMSRVDPLAALSAVGAAGAITAGVVGKMVSQTSSGGGTAIVKRDDHINRVMSSSANKPPTIHKSMDELNKLSESLAMTRIASSQVGGHGMAQSVQNLMPPHSQHQTLPHGHPHSMLQQQFMLPGMMMRPPMPNCQPGQIPQQKRLTNDGDKTSLDGEFVPGSFGSGGGKSDTESNQSGKKTSISLGPGRVSPDSSSGSSSTSGRHAKNSTSLASLSDLPSATESMRDSDTDNTGGIDHQQFQNYHRQMHHQMEHGNGLCLPGPLPLLLETPGYGWSSLVGHENAKEALKNIFIGKNFPEVFDAQGSCRGVLLFGPSGAGKTSLARSLAYEAGGAKLIACASQYVITNPTRPEHAALLVRNMFDHARVQKPCVMLLDDIELFAHPDLSEHGRCARAELMAQVRGESTIEPGYPENTRQYINDHVMLVATTCSPWMLPEELRRLFAYNIHIKLPGEKQREELFRMFLNNSANNVTGDQYKCIISKSEGYSAADIHTVVRQASYNPSAQQGGDMGHHNLPRVVTFDDLGSVMTNYRCLYKPEHLEFYRRYIQEATHKTDEKANRQSKPKGVKKLGSKVARTFMAVLSVID